MVGVARGEAGKWDVASGDEVCQALGRLGRDARNSLMKEAAAESLRRLRK